MWPDNEKESDVKVILRKIFNSWKCVSKLKKGYLIYYVSSKAVVSILQLQLVEIYLRS